MATTLSIESFSEVNLRERSTLAEGVEAGADVLTFASTEGYVSGDILYIGNLSREGCEKAVIGAVDSATTVTLISPLTLPHARFEPVVSVLGDMIHVYRAANIDGNVPIDAAFTVLSTRTIDPDQLSTYYTDSQGSSNYWYRSTYYNAVTLAETDLSDSIPVRGDDFGHYASLSEIRSEAGFSNNYNLKDAFVDQQRRAAEAEINAALSNGYTVPFVSPVPEIVKTLTIKLAAGMLLQAAYGERSSQASLKLNDARDMIREVQESGSGITDGEGNSLAGEGVTFWPDESAPRAFRIGETF